MGPRVILSLATVGVAALVIPPILFAPLHAAAPGHDFDTVVSALEEHYSTHAERVPMMGFISFCAHVWSTGGVKGMRIAEFDNLPQAADPTDQKQLEQIVTNALGSDWQRMITERDARGSVSLIFVRPDGNAMRMLIADYDHGELDLVRLEVNAERMQHWIRDPETAAHTHHQNKKDFD